MKYHIDSLLSYKKTLISIWKKYIYICQKDFGLEYSLWRHLYGEVDEYVSKLCDEENINKMELLFPLFKKAFFQCIRDCICELFFKI